MLIQGGGTPIPYIDEREPDKPKPNILPTLATAGSAALNIAKLNKKMQDDVIKKSGLLDSPDFKYEWDMGVGGVGDKLPTGNVFTYRDIDSPGLFKSAGEQLTFNPEALDQTIPQHIRSKYKLTSKTWNPESARTVMESKGFNEKFTRDILQDRNIPGINILPETFQKDFTTAITEGMTKGIDPMKSARDVWKTAGGNPFFTKPTNIEAAKTVAGGTDIGGPMSQIFKAFSQTKGAGGPGFFKFLMPGAEAAGTTLGGATGAAGTVGGAGAGLFAGMTPIGWTMMALGMIPALKKLFD